MFQIWWRYIQVLSGFVEIFCRYSITCFKKKLPIFRALKENQVGTETRKFQQMSSLILFIIYWFATTVTKVILNEFNLAKFSDNKFTGNANRKVNHHQREHFITGFIVEPKGHLKALANWTIFEQTPLTRNFPGLCGSVSSKFRSLAGVLFSQKNFKNDVKSTIN